MRMMLTARFPTESFNDLVRNGEAGPLMQSILAELKPEAVYFTDHCGERTAVLIIDMEKASDLPKFVEPFFLKFNADCDLRVVMSPEDLAGAGLAELGKKWG
jgi:hypothetical protein